MGRFAKRIMPECRWATRNFSGQEEGFVELGHLDKYFIKKTICAFLSTIRKFFLPSYVPVSVAEHVSVSLNMTKCLCKWLNKLFWLFQGSEYACLSYMFDRLWRCLHFWEQVSELTWLHIQDLPRVLNMSDYRSIRLNNDCIYPNMC